MSEKAVGLALRWMAGVSLERIEYHICAMDTTELLSLANDHIEEITPEPVLGNLITKELRLRGWNRTDFYTPFRRIDEFEHHELRRVVDLIGAFVDRHREEPCNPDHLERTRKLLRLYDPTRDWISDIETHPWLHVMASIHPALPHFLRKIKRAGIESTLKIYSQRAMPPCLFEALEAGAEIIKHHYPSYFKESP